MNDSTSKKADSYLTNRDWDFILVKIKELDELNNKLAIYLDPNIRDYCQAANLVDGRLVIIAANGSVATQIRFQTPDLLLKFKSDPMLSKIRKIDCKVRPPFARTTEKNTIKGEKVQLLSIETAEIVHEIANSLKDSKLRDVMIKIAQHTKDSN